MSEEVVGLQAYDQELYLQMNSFTVIFQQHIQPHPMLPPCIDSTPPSNFEEPPPCFQHLWETLGSRLQEQEYGGQTTPCFDSTFSSTVVSRTSWRDGALLALVGHPCSDGIMMKLPYGVDVLLHLPALPPIFFYRVG